MVAISGLPILRFYNPPYVRELRPRDEGADWEVKLEPPEVSEPGAGRPDGVSLVDEGARLRPSRGPKGDLEPC